jgi:hypothetical protein
LFSQELEIEGTDLFKDQNESSENVKEEEEEKIDTNKSNSEQKRKRADTTEITKPRAISEAFSDVRPVYDDGSLGEELSEEDEEDEGDTSASKPKWNLFGSLKKFFFKGSGDAKDAPTSNINSESDRQYSSSSALENEPPLESKSSSSLIDPALKKSDGEVSKQLKVEIVPESNSHINDPVVLKDLAEDDDVIFEFYYNRLKISSLKTIYELINYQPTHRSVCDPQIVYFRIKDRSAQGNDKDGDSSSDFNEYTKNDEKVEEDSEKIRQKVMFKAIVKQTEGMLPTISDLYSTIGNPVNTSPVVVPTNGSTVNPYSYNYNAYQPKSKIGETLQEQRESAFKVLKVMRVLTYIMENWDEFRIHCMYQGFELKQDFR